ncbi:MAG: efflux RND transporter periplasmic adaptor subunit [Acidobacteria bacterium]|nr:efflux RND transporter periplasmic adaptor subunit [Acidobacteriota bacterium]
MATEKSRRLWLFLALIILVAGVFVYRSRQRSVPLVRTAKVERQDIHAGIVTNGKVEPIEFQDLRAEVEGEVTRVLVREGDAVRQGQRLVELSWRQTTSALEHARAELGEAENALRLLEQGGSALELRELRAQLKIAGQERDDAAKLVAENERLVAKGAVARVELEQSRVRLARAETELSILEQKLSNRYEPEDREQAEARVQAARAALDLAQSRQSATSVVSPLDGIAYAVPVRPGDYVRSGDLLVRTGNLNRVRVRVFVDEPDLGRVAPAQPVLVTWDGLPGKQWQGVVERLPSKVQEVGTRTVGEVSCTLDNPEMAMIPNMNVNVEIVTESQPLALTLPREAVIEDGGGQYVYIVRDGALLRQPVQTGISNPTRVEIRQGLQEGDEAALAGEEPLREGMRVRNGAG